MKSFSTRYDTAQLSLTIIDVNDNAPSFLDSPYSVSVMENDDDNNNIVFTANAADPDGKPFNRVEYSLRDDYDGKSLLIDCQTI